MTELNKQKIFWHSRRGMLELDLLLVPFAREVFENLSTEDQLLYRDLLAEEDQDLWNWFLERVEPSEARFKAMIERILAHKANQVYAGTS
ncbi:MAG: succinate dehydrogenase assembly factor 2 [Pseudomonadales bacterium]|nr:succinate dehydrogenase assembly factor 2 [Pseudomonadales bacterium]